MESCKLVEVTRGEMAESVHRGVVAVVDNRGNNIFTVGDPQYYTYIRSAAKPMQAVSVFESGALEHFGFNDQELAIITSSHSGEKAHEEVVLSILNKIGLDMSNLLCGITAPLHKPTAKKMSLENIKPGPIHCNCSGKHAGMLAMAMYKKLSLNDYYLLEHPVQQLMLETIGEFSETSKEHIKIGIDGCGVPVFGLPVQAMALAYANFIKPEKFNAKRQEACRRISTAMVENPHLVAGSERFTTILQQQLGGKIVAKDGTEAVFCLGLPKQGLGIAVKIEDGGPRALAPVVLRVLDKLGVLAKSDLEALKPHYQPQIKNFRDEVIGEIRAIF